MSQTVGLLTYAAWNHEGDPRELRHLVLLSSSMGVVVCGKNVVSQTAGINISSPLRFRLRVSTLNPPQQKSKAPTSDVLSPQTPKP